MFDMIINNTLAVLGPVVVKNGEWRNNLIALLNGVSGLLDANGDATGIGTELTDIHVKIWQEIVQELSQNLKSPIVSRTTVVQRQSNCLLYESFPCSKFMFSVR
jgi:hypothetical protein